MPVNGKFFINKVIEDNDVSAFNRHSIHEEDFISKTDKEVYKYIVDFSKYNDGNAPSYANVASEFPEFEYIPEITESYKYLAKKIKDTRGKSLVLDMFETGKFEDNLNDKDSDKFISWVIEEFTKIKTVIDTKEDNGKSIKKDGDTFISRYEAIQKGESNKVFKSMYSVIGQYSTGNMYVLYGKSGRGKSVITLAEAISVAMQGGTVLYWGMELNWYEIMSRLYAIFSGVGELVETRVMPNHRMFAGEDGRILGGFNPRDLQRGELGKLEEEEFRKMLARMNELMDGDIIIRAVDDPEFTHRSARDLEDDIEATGADFVIVDPFYYMDYEANTSRKTGGDAEATSQRLRRLTGTKDCVILALTQADETDSEAESEDGIRELELPKRSEVKKTSALLEDASLLIAIDTNYYEGVGVVGINKGRGGGEGQSCNIIFLPQYGVVKEIQTGIGALEGFNI